MSEQKIARAGTIPNADQNAGAKSVQIQKDIASFANSNAETQLALKCTS